MDEKAINQLYRSLGKDKTENAQILETIIECKHQNIQLMNTGQTLYRDLKMWCYNYISSKQEKDYGYDIYEHSKITEKLNDNALKDRQKLALIHYVKFVLSQYNDDGSWLDEDTKSIKLAVLKKEDWLKYLILLSSSSKWRCMKTILLFFIVELVILLPAPFEWMELFDFQQANYTEYGWLNYITNVLAIKIDWIEGPKLVCLNWCGVVLCGFWLMVYVVFVVNILFNNIFANISEYDEQ